MIRYVRLEHTRRASNQKLIGGQKTFVMLLDWEMGGQSSCRKRPAERGLR